MHFLNFKYERWKLEITSRAMLPVKFPEKHCHSGSFTRRVLKNWKMSQKCFMLIEQTKRNLRTSSCSFRRWSFFCGYIILHTKISLTQYTFLLFFIQVSFQFSLLKLTRKYRKSSEELLYFTIEIKTIKN